MTTATMMANKAALVFPEFPIVTRLVKDLEIHPKAQREALSPSKVNWLVGNMRVGAIGVLHGVEYPINGRTSLWIIDGYHRLAALKLCGLLDFPVRLQIHTDCKDDASAAQRFIDLNNRVPVRTWDLFRTELLARNVVASSIVAIASEFSYGVDKFSGPHHLACVSSLKSIYKIDDGRTLRKTLDIVTQAWGYVVAIVEGKFLEGVARVIETNPDIDFHVLKTKLSKFPGGASAIMGSAKGPDHYSDSALPARVERVIVNWYNRARSGASKIRHSKDD